MSDASRDGTSERKPGSVREQAGYLQRSCTGGFVSRRGCVNGRGECVKGDFRLVRQDRSASFTASDSCKVLRLNSKAGFPQDLVLSILIRGPMALLRIVCTRATKRVTTHARGAKGRGGNAARTSGHTEPDH